MKSFVALECRKRIFCILTIFQNGERKEYRITELKDEPVRPEVV
jgi:hypothetical protein